MTALARLRLAVFQPDLLQLLLKLTLIACFFAPSPLAYCQWMHRSKTPTPQETAAQQQFAATIAKAAQAANVDSDFDTPPATALKPANLTAKKPGVVRIGVVLPSGSMSTANGRLSDGEPIRNAEMQLLAGPRIETVRLTAILPAQAAEEARALDCDYVLTTSLSQQKAESTGRFAKFANMRTVQLATTAAQFIPGVQATAMLASMATSQLLQQSMQKASNDVKANSDVVLDYKLTDLAGNVALTDAEKARSKKDGDDVITPLLTTAASRILTAVVR